MLVQEYSPKEISIVNPRTAVVRMNSKKDLDEFMRKYNEAVAYSLPKFLVLPFIENRFNEMNKMGIGMNQHVGMNLIPNNNFPVNLGQIPGFQNMPPYSKKNSKIITIRSAYGESYAVQCCRASL